MRAELPLRQASLLNEVLLLLSGAASGAISPGCASFSRLWLVQGRSASRGKTNQLVHRTLSRLNAIKVINDGRVKHCKFKFNSVSDDPRGRLSQGWLTSGRMVVFNTDSAASPTRRPLSEQDAKTGLEPLQSLRPWLQDRQAQDSNGRPLQRLLDYQAPQV